MNSNISFLFFLILGIYQNYVLLSEAVVKNSALMQILIIIFLIILIIRQILYLLWTSKTIFKTQI